MCELERIGGRVYASVGSVPPVDVTDRVPRHLLNSTVRRGGTDNLCDGRKERIDRIKKALFDDSDGSKRPKKRVEKGVKKRMSDWNWVDQIDFFLDLKDDDRMIAFKENRERVDEGMKRRRVGKVRLGQDG